MAVSKNLFLNRALVNTRKVKRAIDVVHANTLAAVLTGAKLSVRTEVGATPHWNPETSSIVLPPLPSAPTYVHSMLILHETGHVRFTDNKAWAEFVLKFNKLPWLAKMVHEVVNIFEDKRIDGINMRVYNGTPEIYKDAAKWLYDVTYCKARVYDMIGFNKHCHTEGEYNTSFYLANACWGFKLNVGDVLYDYSANQIETELCNTVALADNFSHIIEACEKYLFNVFGDDLYDVLESIDPKSDDTATSVVDGALFQKYAGRWNVTRKVVYSMCSRTLKNNTTESGEPLTKSDVKQIRKLMVSMSSDMSYNPADAQKFADMLGQLAKLVDEMNQAEANGKPISGALKYKLNKVLSGMGYDGDSVYESCETRRDASDGKPNGYTGRDSEFSGDIVEFTIPPNYKPLTPDNTASTYNLGDTDFAEFIRYSQPIVGRMANDFHVKKAASIVRNTKRAKSGELNSDKLAEYKGETDLFLRAKKEFKHKNHGLWFLIDLSGSMSGERLLGSVRNMVVLTEFCNRSRIPYEVYGFTSATGAHCETDTMHMHDVGMYRLVTSSMDTATRTKHVESLYAFASNAHSSYVSMGGTPLDSAIVVAMDLASRFKASKNIEVLSTVILTDGENNGDISYTHSGGGSSKHPIYMDAYNKNMYYPNEELGNTHRLLTMYKDLIGGNLIGIMIDSTPRIGSIDSASNNMYRGTGYDVLYSYNADEIKYEVSNKQALTFVSTFVSMIAKDYSF